MHQKTWDVDAGLQKQTIANSRPPPRASPSMAATIGFLESMVTKQESNLNIHNL